jgi:hypothetical protein
MQSDLALHLDKLLAKLRAEKALVDQAIVDLERLEQGRKRPRGRPPGRSGSEQRLSRERAAAAGGDIG